MSKYDHEHPSDRKADAWVPYTPPESVKVYRGGTVPTNVPTEEFFEQIHAARDEYETAKPEEMSQPTMEGKYRTNSGQLVESEDPREVATKREAAARRRRVQ